MKRFVCAWILVGMSFFAVGCSQTTSGPAEGSPEDEALIEEDLDMQQEELSGDLGAGGDSGGGGEPGAP